MNQTALRHEVQGLYSEHGHWLRGWLRGRLGCSEQAADLAQDTFVRLLSRGEPVAAQAPRAYLATVARGLVADLLRRRALEQAYLAELASVPEAFQPSLEDRAILMETLLAIDRMLDGLPPPVREAFLLSQLEGLTYADIAGRLGVTVRTVNNYMLKAMTACYALAA